MLTTHDYYVITLIYGKQIREESKLSYDSWTSVASEFEQHR